MVSAIPVDRTEMTIVITCKDDGSPPLEDSQNISLIIKEIVTIPKEVKLTNQRPVPENTDSFNVGKFQVFNMLTNKPVENEVCDWLKLLSLFREYFFKIINFYLFHNITYCLVYSTHLCIIRTLKVGQKMVEHQKVDLNITTHSVCLEIAKKSPKNKVEISSSV